MTLTDDLKASAGAAPLSVKIEVALLTGGFDPHYTFGLASALISKEVDLEIVGGDELDSLELRASPQVKFRNLRGNQQPGASILRKLSRLGLYYARLIRYAATAKPEIFHVLWNSKIEFLDRTLLMLHYKMCGKAIVLTVHNVNSGKRDLNDSLVNRLTLRMQYRLSDHLFVHTEKMKCELLQDFGVGEGAITVIPYGINNSVPDTDLTAAQAKQRLGVKDDEKVILFFGTIRPYKGIEYLLAAFKGLLTIRPNCRLIIAGEPKKESREYLDEIERIIKRDFSVGQVIQHTRYIPDDETECYFKAADVSVLPYTHIFQSGVLFLGYSFGLPVIAADVGSLKEDIIEGKTGFVFKPKDSVDLAGTLERYFASDLYHRLSSNRLAIQDYVKARHSWDIVGGMTRKVYLALSGNVGTNAFGVSSHSRIT